MNQKISIKPEKAKIAEYISDFEKGLLQVPAFQRDFIWNNEKKLDLFDSIKKGYPIGSILLWQPNFDKEEDYDNFGGKELGAYSIPKRSSNSFYILDGFQRLSTLIGSLLHPQKASQKGLIQNKDEWRKKFNIVYNLEVGEFEINRSMNFERLEKYQVPIYKLVDGKEFFQFQKSLFDEDDSTIKKYIERYEEISLIFQNYELPKINIVDGSITEAVDIFQRLNSMGAPITADWVVSARAFGKDNNYRLGSEIDKLLENELDIYNFQSLKREIILQCITNSFGDVYFDQMSKRNNRKLEDLVDRPDFIPVTKKTFVAIQQAVKFLYEELYVLDSKLLPYNSQLIFITDFFNNVACPNRKQLDTLKRWFWITTYSNYFTIYNLSKQRLAYNKFQEFIQDENINPVFYDNKDQFESLEFPDKIDMGSVRKKALALFMINYSLNQNDIDNTVMLDANEIIGLRTMKIFKDESTAENTIFLIEKYFDASILPKNLKELAVMLLSGTDKVRSEHFVDKKMQYEYNKHNVKNVLQVRKQLIVNAEKKFVENLGLNYIQ